jgi:SWIRM domain/SWIRM-associated domain at the N-terminal
VIPELTQIVEKHGGSVVETAIEASHIIVSDELIDSLPSELPEDYLRVVDSTEGGAEVIEKARVHFIFHPDSYDDDIQTRDIDGDISAEVNSCKSRSVADTHQWKVCVRFIRDCEIFNEWGNEMDYELEDIDATEGVPPSAPSSKRNYTALKRKRTAGNSGTVAMDIPDEVSADKAAQADDADGCASDVVETGHSNATGNPSLKRKADSPDEISLSVAGKPKKGSRKSLQSQLKSPIWFSTESVNSLEITNLPEFFSPQPEAGTANTDTYIEIRNFIVTLYSSNPYVFLSATECRRRIAGDVCVILKIHNFLDSFGVINFNVKSDCRPTLTAPLHYSLTKSSATTQAAQTPLLPNNSTSSSSGTDVSFLFSQIISCLTFDAINVPQFMLS